MQSNPDFGGLDMDGHRYFKMTLKTRIFLWFYRQFEWIGQIGQWFIRNCDMMPEDYDPFAEEKEIEEIASAIKSLEVLRCENPDGNG